MQNNASHLPGCLLFLLELCLFLVYIVFLTLPLLPFHVLAPGVLSVVFGLVSLVFSGTAGTWFHYLRSNERKKLMNWQKIDQDSANHIAGDYGPKGDAWIFRILSIVVLGAAVYGVVRYFGG